MTALKIDQDIPEEEKWNLDDLCYQKNLNGTVISKKSKHGPKPR